MRKITVLVPDQVYRRVRRRAAARDTSVSALVAVYLASLADEESDFERRRRLQDEVLASVRRFRARGRLKRDEAHDRDAVRSHAATDELAGLLETAHLLRSPRNAARLRAALDRTEGQRPPAVRGRPQARVRSR